MRRIGLSSAIARLQSVSCGSHPAIMPSRLLSARRDGAGRGDIADVVHADG
jgi:hypothetical protein